jgi:hypothetical protein
VVETDNDHAHYDAGVACVYVRVHLKGEVREATWRARISPCGLEMSSVLKRRGFCFWRYAPDNDSMTFQYCVVCFLFKVFCIYLHCGLPHGKGKVLYNKRN